MTFLHGENSSENFALTSGKIIINTDDNNVEYS